MNDEIKATETTEEIESNILTDEQLDTVVETAAEFEDQKLAAAKEAAVVDETAPLEEGVVNVNEGESIIHAINTSSEESSNDEEATQDIFDIDTDADINTELTDSAKQKMSDTAKSTFDLSDEEVLALITLASEYRKDPNVKVFHMMPAKLQTMIGQFMLTNNIPISAREDVAKSVLNEMLSSAEVDAAFADLDEALNQALNIPSIVDLYSDHIRSVMEEKIPEMIEKIKDEEPEKAQKLQMVKDAFTDAYKFTSIKDAYLSQTRVRKAVRRQDYEYERCVKLYNFMHRDTKFKMNDAGDILPALIKAFIVFPNDECKIHDVTGTETTETTRRIKSMLISEEDLKKFIVLALYTCQDKDATDVISVSYMYYLVKNLITLAHNQEAKTPFSVELINNICDMIAFIRDEEAKFYAKNNLDKSKRGKKHNSTGSSKR